MNITMGGRSRVALLGLALLAAGCGSGGTGSISGKVTYKDQPLAGATITFYDVANTAVSDIIDADGNYKVQNIATGTARVVVLKPIPIKGMAITAGDKPAAGKSTMALPAKYSTPDQSGLTLDVKRGSQTKDFVLTD